MKQEVLSYKDLEDTIYDIKPNPFSIVKNLIISDPTTNLGVINRFGINYNDGFIENTILQANILDKEKNKDSNEPIFELNNIGFIDYDIALSESQIGYAGFMFHNIDNFSNMYHSMSNITRLDAPINPEYNIITNNRVLKDTMNYKDIYQYALHNDTLPILLYSKIAEFIFIIHEIINCLLPKQIVIIGDSQKGINIMEYIPLISLENIPDIKNKLLHTIEILKSSFSSQTTRLYIGDFHVKLSITPAVSVINLVNKNTKRRLMLTFPTLYNNLMDIERVNLNLIN